VNIIELIPKIEFDDTFRDTISFSINKYFINWDSIRVNIVIRLKNIDVAVIYCPRPRDVNNRCIVFGNTGLIPLCAA
jgi:hypothetical protein